MFEAESSMYICICFKDVLGFIAGKQIYFTDDIFIDFCFYLSALF